MKTWKQILASILVFGLVTFTAKSLATLSNTSSQTVTAVGNGVTTSYVIGFSFQDNDEVHVYTVAESNGAISEVLQGSGATKFTITGGDPGTTVVMGAAPTSAQHLLIKRITPQIQSVDYDPNTAFPANDHETQMDHMVQMIQEVSNGLSSAVGSAITNVTNQIATVQSFDLQNVGLSVFSGGAGVSTYTVALKQANGLSDANGSSTVSIAYRLAGSGGGFQSVATAAGLSVVIPYNATLGGDTARSGVSYYLNVYGLNNAGTNELAVSLSKFDEGSLQSTVAISSAGDSATKLYSASARTSVPVRFLGRVLMSQAVTGDYQTAPREISLNPTSNVPVAATYGLATDTTYAASAEAPVTYDAKLFDTHNMWQPAIRGFVIPERGIYRVEAHGLLAGTSTAATNRISIDLFQNNNQIAQMTRTLIEVVQAGTWDSTGSYTFPAEAGDSIQVRYIQTSTNSFTTGTNPQNNFVSIYKLLGTGTVP